jgi:hypothetical protein
VAGRGADCPPQAASEAQIAAVPTTQQSRVFPAGLQRSRGGVMPDLIIVYCVIDDVVACRLLSM